MAASASFAQFLKASPPFTGRAGGRAGAGIILSNGGTRARVTQADILMSSPRPPSASCPLCKEEKRREGNVLSVKSLSLPSLEEVAIMTVKCLLAMLILLGTDYRDADAAGIPPL